MKKILLYLWVQNFHYVVYPISNNNEAFNLHWSVKAQINSK